MENNELEKYIDEREEWLNRLIKSGHDKHGCYERRDEIQHLRLWLKKRNE